MLKSLFCASISVALLASVARAEEPLARVPLVPTDTTIPVVKTFFDGVRSRGGQPLNMHRTIANAPGVFKQFNDLALALRTEPKVRRADRELMILRMTDLAQGIYEFTQHTPMAISCGMSMEQVEALPKWRETNLFSDRQRAILAYADQMSSKDSVDDATFATLKRFLSDEEIVELTLTGSFYFALSQTTRALGVKLEPNAGKTAYGKC